MYQTALFPTLKDTFWTKKPTQGYQNNALRKN